MAILMSVAFALPVYYLCQMQGSFFVFWLAWLISLADGIGECLAQHLPSQHAFVLPLCIMLPDSQAFSSAPKDHFVSA